MFLYYSQKVSKVFGTDYRASYYFINLNVEYKFKESKFSAFFRINNIFNNKSFNILLFNKRYRIYFKYSIDLEIFYVGFKL